MVVARTRYMPNLNENFMAEEASYFLRAASNYELVKLAAAAVC
jgi:hypothetical protein